MSQTAKPGATSNEVPADRRMVAQMWPLLLAAALGLVPFTVMSTFLVPIARDAGESAELIGGLRGLGGLAALVLGASAAPLVDRMPRNRVAGLALGLLAVGCLASVVVGATAGWVIFCLVIGSSTSLLTPALSAMAADRYTHEAAAGRAATMVASTTTLTAVLSAPLLAAPAQLWGWQGDMLAAAAIAAVLAVVLWRTADVRGEGDGSRPGYVAAFAAARRVPGAVPLLVISTVRTTCFMGQLAYVAVFFDERHGLTPGAFSLVWMLSGSAFFVGSWWAGRFLAHTGAPERAPRLAGQGAGVAAVAVAAIFLSSWLLVSVLAVAGVALGHAVVAASVVTLLVRRAGPVRGTLMSLNASGQSLGVFLGAALVGACLSWGGWLLVAAVLAATMVGCVVLALGVIRREPAAPGQDTAE